MADVLSSDVRMAAMAPMTFHWGTHEVLLFDIWVTTGPLSFALSCVVIFTLSACAQLFRCHLSGHCTDQNATAYTMFAVNTTMSLLLMLLAMTFNYGVFVTIVAGATFGHALCARYSKWLHGCDVEYPYATFSH
eukprot:TRINITY_DN15970_c0_g1_i1.p1 TRINITY_DN15970_c0_g1~~TRINITY_DN15970_c0_g1_i1.p1  ORF type:complete len:153 (+),score=29.69 TRINITY_DN15970_c0_g1_i1:60-461(+)